MSDGIDIEVIKKTQHVLGKHVKKPPLTEKLLCKPPFRFLHDVVVAVIKNTGFLKGLYTKEELSAENVKERDAKLAFLNKLIEAVKTVTKKDLKVKASKIIAGLQVNETNLLLQAIAYGIENKVDSNEYVKKKNEKTNKPTAKTISVRKDKTSQSPKEHTPKDKKVKENKSEKSTSRESKAKKDKSGSKRSDTITKIPEKNFKSDNVDSPDSVSKTSLSNLVAEETKVDLKDFLTEANETSSETKITEEEEERPRTRDIQNGFLAKIEKNEVDVNIQENPMKKDANAEILSIDSNQNITTNIRQHSARPKSARPKSGEPRGEVENVDNKTTKKESDGNETLVLQTSSTQRPKSSLRPPSVRPSSARPGAPRLRPDSALPVQEVVSMGKINVIIENFDNDAVDDESVVIQNAPEEIMEIDATMDIPSKNQSHLVEQIMDQIKESDQIVKPILDNDWEQDNLRGRDTTSKEMNHLRNLIQNFTRTANPLGKLLNYLHEDIETMHSELQQWSKIKNQLYAEMTKQEKIKSEIDRPLYGKLESLNIEIAKMEQEIIDVKSSIIKNDFRINKIITK